MLKTINMDTFRKGKTKYLVDAIDAHNKMVLY